MIKKIVEEINRTIRDINEEKEENDYDVNSWMETFENFKKGIRFVKGYTTKEEAATLESALQDLRVVMFNQENNLI